MPSYDKAPPFIPLMIDACTANGVLVSVRPGASAATHNAAKSLVSVMNDVLSQNRTLGEGLAIAVPPSADLPDDVIEIVVGQHIPNPEIKTTK